MFDELQTFSSFVKGRFKTSNFLLIYNIGMGKYVGPVGVDKNFVIVSSANYDENFNYLSTDLYYINKDKHKKIFLFNSLGYNYELKLTASEYIINKWI